MNFNKKDLNKKDTLCLIAVFVFSFLCTVKMMFFSMSGGILNPDIATYLLTALKYAGLDYYNIVDLERLYYTPIISFLTSLFFRMGYVDKNAIIIVTSAFCFMGYIGLYSLLRNRFDSLLSLLGVIIFGSLSVVIFNLSKGMIDIPALSISLWILVFSILAIDKNEKYFLIAFPLLVVGFFTKYTVGFMLPVVLLYYAIKRNLINNIDCCIDDGSLFKSKILNYIHSKEFKYIIISLLISIILFYVICKFLLLDFGGSLSFFNQATETINGKVYSINLIDFHIQKSYYLLKFPEILFEKQFGGMLLAYCLFSIIGIGLIFKGYDVIAKLIHDKPSESFKNRKFKKVLLIILIASVIISSISFKVYSNHMISNISLLLAILIIYSLLEKYDFNKDHLSLDLVVLAYFLINFIFISLYPAKAYRYALTFMPPFIYIVIWGLNELLNKINSYDNLKISNLSKFIPIVLIAVFLMSTIAFMQPMEIEKSNEAYAGVTYKGFVNDLYDVCKYIDAKDPNHNEKTFASYYHHHDIIKWYLNVDVIVLDEDDPDLLDFNETDYVILNEDKSLNNYHEVYHKGDFYLYYHN